MKVKLTFRSEDARAMDSFIRDVVKAVRESGGRVSGPVPLPTRFESRSPKSNSYLGSLAGKSAVHLRAMTVDGMTPKVREALDGLKAPGVVEISISG